MANPEGFFALSETAKAEQTIDKSTFIAVACPARSVENTEENMRQVRADYPKARHYVYAYRLWCHRGEKASDDGEPQGTGGRPVLNALVYRQIWDVQIIVVRYFGGILLGTGGLTRAYGGVARLALEKATVFWMAEHLLLYLDISYSFYDEFRYSCIKRKWLIEKEEYGERVLVTLAVPATEERQWTSWLGEHLCEQIVCLNQERVWRKVFE